MICNEIIKFTDKGQIAGTFDHLGRITLREDAKEIIGCRATLTLGTTVPGEVAIAIVKFYSPDLLYSERQFVVPFVADSRLSTGFFPIIPDRPGLGRAILDYQLSCVESLTEGFTGAIETIYGTDVIPQEIKASFLNQPIATPLLEPQPKMQEWQRSVIGTKVDQVPAKVIGAPIELPQGSSVEHQKEEFLKKALLADNPLEYLERVGYWKL